MKITIESTTKTLTLDGVPARVWEGKTESGIPVMCYVTHVCVMDEDADHTQFENELKACRAPSSMADALAALEMIA